MYIYTIQFLYRLQKTEKCPKIFFAGKVRAIIGKGAVCTVKLWYRMIRRLEEIYIRKHKEEFLLRKQKWDEEFYECIQDITKHPVVLRMKLYPHHGNTNCYQHCLHVSYYNYVWCRFFHLDAKSAARGGMLHDLFLYDWHTHAKETGQRFHGLTHPKTALNHACRLFSLNDIEKDVIRAHMWPVTFFSIPHTKEGWIITLTDKYCGAFESMKRK